MIDYLVTVNLSLFRYINSVIGVYPWLDAFILFIAQYYIFILIAVTILFVYRESYKEKTKAFRLHLIGLVFALTSVMAVLQILRLAIPYPRPFLSLDIAYLFTVGSASFPSGHTIFIFGLATALYFYGTRGAHKLAWFLSVSGVLIGLARIAAGVHYPVDIIGGIVLGILVAVIAEIVSKRIFVRSV